MMKFIFGSVFGLIVGLGIALIVTVNINKVPVPLIGKKYYSFSDETLGIDEKWNPNDILTPLKTETVNEDLIGDFVANLNEQNSATKLNSEENFLYFVQVGSFFGVYQADKLKAELALAGFQANLDIRNQDNGEVIFRVRLGPFSTRIEAEQLQQNLFNLGKDSILIRSEK